MGHRAWRLRRISDIQIEYKVLGRFSSASKGTEEEDESILKDYFQLDSVPDVTQLYKAWCEKDSVFRNICQTSPEKFGGIRILRQDPLECTFSFICSSNNNIKRISSKHKRGMVEKLCVHYGESLSIDTGEKDNTVFHDFPTLTQLTTKKSVELKLKELGFGYRAKYIAESSEKLRAELGGEEWLRSLRNVEYESAKQSLLSLIGVGSKVADCICLMSLDKKGVVPVDTHVWDITRRHYLPQLKDKGTLTSSIHTQINDFYQNRFGDYAGWAHSVLFSADLKKFSTESEPSVKTVKKRLVTQTNSKTSASKHKRTKK